MDLNQAIEKHTQWKVKFRTAINAQEKMDAITIAKDNCCELGKWLHGEAKAKFASLPSYALCVSKHAAFHSEASKIAHAINAKKYTEAEAMLNAGTAYTMASNEVGMAITKMKKECNL